MKRPPLRPPFVPSPRFQRVKDEGLWFVFRGCALLVLDGLELPRSLRAHGLTPLRTQFLGHLQETPCMSAELPPDAEPPAGAHFHELRDLYKKLPEHLIDVAGRAVQVMDWDRTHQRCGVCGESTRPHSEHRARTCPSCSLEFYPRLAPAIIVAVERGPELLLARAPNFPPGIYSVLSGFVDPGETAEQAVYREVLEESGIHVKNVRYFGSQAWPFPHSLMLAYQADYEAGTVKVDGKELEAGAFFRVDALPPSFPERISISEWLIDDFRRRHLGPDGGPRD